MGSSLRLFWAGLSVLALGVASCSSTTVPPGFDGGGGAGGPTDGPKTDGAKTDGATTDGAKSDAMDARGPDLNVPPPAMLTATVLDRRATTFELLWTAPSAGGAAVSGYQVRYAKVPITAANFDNTTMTTVVPYTGTPKAPGETDGMIVKAYIENGYYFAVIGTDSGGTNVGTLMATTAAVSAHFNQTLFPSTSGTNEELAYSVSSGDDLNGDGLSDVLVGTFEGGKAYLFFGNANFVTGAPAVTFSGTAAGFGSEVAEIGDIDHDGKPDIAIADPYNANSVYIYKGRQTWPLTLSSAQADYVISTDASYTGKLFGFSIAGLGDFTGDGVDDLAIGVPAFGTGLPGRVVIIPGKTTGFSSVALPDATKSIVIDGDSSLTNPIFGYRVLGLGHYYSVSAATTLISSAPGTAGSGHVYAFHGQAGVAGAIAIGTADQVIAGPTGGGRIGLALENMGPVIGALPNVGIGNPSDTFDGTGFNGTAYVTSGDGTSGPLTTKIIVSQSGSTAAGGVVLGGSTSGRDLKLSLIGDATPDVVLGSETGTSIGIADGKILATRTGVVDLTKVEVTFPLPSGFALGEASGALIPDINGDGYPDFCLGKATGAIPGALAVYW